MNRLHDMSLEEASNRFYSTFGSKIKDAFGVYTHDLLCATSLFMSSKCSLDILAFEGMLTKEFGMDTSLGCSMHDFILDKWGQDKVDLVYYFIQGVPIEAHFDT